MENPMTVASNRSALIVALLILVISVAVLIAAYDFPGGSGVFPRFVGWIFVGLTALEVLFQLKTMLASPVTHRTAGPIIDEGVIKETRGFLWLVFFLMVVFLSGFMIGIPIYIFTFLRLSAGRSLKECVIMSVSATLFIYILFMELLESRLYPGVLFGA